MWAIKPSPVLFGTLSQIESNSATLFQWWQLSSCWVFPRDIPICHGPDVYTKHLHRVRLPSEGHIFQPLTIFSGMVLKLGKYELYVVWVSECYLDFGLQLHPKMLSEISRCTVHIMMVPCTLSAQHREWKEWKFSFAYCNLRWESSHCPSTVQIYRGSICIESTRRNSNGIGTGEEGFCDHSNINQRAT